jgi:hypothetical protein
MTNSGKPYFVSGLPYSREFRRAKVGRVGFLDSRPSPGPGDLPRPSWLLPLG